VAALLRDADVAMYSAKGEGGGRWQVFEPAMLDAAQRRLELKSALNRAVELNELVLNYQPIVDLEAGGVRGVEALVRWIHPQRGLIAPLDFIPLAEETGQIIPIGGWVLAEACRAAVRLGQALPGHAPIYMSVNLSGHQLQRPEIVAEVAEALRTSGLAPESLVLEITESVLMADIELTIERLHAFKGLGIRLAIDDFGTGYSSLNYLRRFPVDIVKVDRSFLDEIETDPDQRALVAMIVDLAIALGLRRRGRGNRAAGAAGRAARRWAAATARATSSPGRSGSPTSNRCWPPISPMQWYRCRRPRCPRCPPPSPGPGSGRWRCRRHP
jgi:EAL domain-containing protein (putative c-di-GMP-specific phosphodiesterase class I)